MEYDTVVKILAGFFRLVGTVSSGQELTEQGEDQDDIAYLNITRGCRKAQRWMLQNGFGGWRKRTATVLSFSGSDSVDGGRFTTLPSDFLRAYGDHRRSCLTEANGDRWGEEITEQEDHKKGDLFYFRGHELWLSRVASPPTNLYLDYHFIHPAWDDALQAGDGIDFPMEARYLIVAMAAETAMDDNWLPGGQELEGKIGRAVKRAQNEARHIARPTKQPRQFQKVRRFGNRW